MFAEIGHFALILSLCLAVLQAVIPLWGAIADRDHLRRTAPILAFGQFIFVFLTFSCLLFSYVLSDFSVLNVWENSHSLKPLLYKISGLWGNHEGSMLLWVLILAFFGWLLALSKGNFDLRLKSDALAVQAWIAAAFLLFILFASNPFLRLDPVPLDGKGLNPVLQDVALAIHPPLLYVGYVGFSIVFSLAAAGLLHDRIDRSFAAAIRPWVLLAWMFLTAGIGVGSWWAYYELGWGGWWFWDPVENASLMPWLSGTALLHSVAVMERRGALKVWTLFLAILTFSLSLLGTFLVRSGILTSVHAFAVDPARGLFILYILGFFVGGGFLLFMWRAPFLRQGAPFAPISREGAIILNNLFLVSALASVLIGTFYPLFLEYITGDKISVGPPFFNMSFGSLMCLAFLILPIGPMLAWKKGDLSGVLERLVFAGGGAMALAGVGLFFQRGGSLFAFLGISLALWLMIGSLLGIIERIRLFQLSLGESWQRLKGIPLSSIGAVLAHIGLGVTLLGIVAVSSWRSERIVSMGVGDTVQIGEYHATLDSVSFRQGSNYVDRLGRFTLRRGGVPVKVVEASRRSYVIPRQTTSEVGLWIVLAGDIYIVFGEALESGKTVVYLHTNPLVTLIWWGLFFMIAGGLLCLSGSRLLFFLPVKRLSKSAALTLLFCLLLFSGQAVQAVQPDEILQDPVLEGRARHLSSQLRCVVCQSQSIDDSEAQLARDMRLRVRERLLMGESDQEVIDHLVERYGTFILLKPPLQGNTIILWIFPPLFLFLGACFVWYFIRQQGKTREEEGKEEGDNAF